MTARLVSVKGANQHDHMPNDPTASVFAVLVACASSPVAKADLLYGKRIVAAEKPGKDLKASLDDL